MIEKSSINKTSRDDMAFFNSVLSYGIYTNREWMLGLNEFGNESQTKSFDDVVTEAAFQLFDSKASPKELMRRNYELYISAYIKNNFEKFSLTTNELSTYTSKKYGYKTRYQFNESDYNSLNNLARAGYFLSNNSDGTKNIHLVFRGTDSKAKGFIEFVSKAYLDMSAYYEAFKPLEAQILEFAKDPKNNIKSIHVSGHSLGGAMVQEFFKSSEVKNSGLDMKGFTYGAPGTDKKPIHNMITESFHTIKEVLRTGKFSSFLNMAKYTLVPMFNNILPQSLAMGNLASVATLGFNFSDLIPPSMLPEKRFIEKRVFQYEHSGDLIPRIGAAAYIDSGEEIYLKDVASQNIKDTFMLTGNRDKNYKHKSFAVLAEGFNKMIKKPVNFVHNMFKFEYHDMMRYVVNLEHKIGKDYDKSESPHYSQFMDYKSRFNRNTADRSNDVIYQRLMNINVEGTVPNKIMSNRLPKEIESIINRSYNIQTTQNVISDILGKKVSYDLKSFNIAGSETDIESKIPQLDGNSVDDIAKNASFPNKEHITAVTDVKIQQIKNIRTLRDKFLSHRQQENKPTI